MRFSTGLVAATALCCSWTITAAATLPELDKLREKAVEVCYDDAMKFCSDFVPDEQQVALCLKENRSKVSSPCSKVIQQGLKMLEAGR